MLTMVNQSYRYIFYDTFYSSTIDLVGNRYILFAIDNKSVRICQDNSLVLSSKYFVIHHFLEFSLFRNRFN